MDSLEPVHILNAEPSGYSQQARAVLDQVGRVTDGQLSPSELIDRLSEFDVLIVRLAHQIDRRVIDASSRLKAIVSATTGLDHIDVAYAEERDVTVLSLRGETDFLLNVSASAEHTWAILLALMRRVVPALASVKKGEWNRDTYRGHDLDGRRLGLVGLGRVGNKVAAYGLAFGMSVSAYDPYLRDWPAIVTRTESLEKLLRDSDVLSLHPPLNSETVGMIGRTELAQLQEGAVLINTSRGQVVDEAALVEVLETGKLAGAALDVLSNERAVVRRGCGPLLEYANSHDNLLITPHIAGATFESMAKTELFMANKLKRFLEEVDWSARKRKSAAQTNA